MDKLEHFKDILIHIKKIRDICMLLKITKRFVYDKKKKKP